MRWALLIALLAAALGCGSASSAPSGDSAADPTAELTIAYWPEGRDDGGMKRWTLRCDPMGGTHTRRAAACSRLSSMQRPFAPQHKLEVCTQIYGGPDQARVTGEFRGQRISVELSLTDGCKIARFKRLQFLVPGLTVTNSGVAR